MIKRITKHFSVLLFLLVCGNTLFGQEIDFNNYSTITSSGTLPDEFSSSSTKKYYTRKDRISKKEARKIRKLKGEFYLESAFAIDDLLKSGRVVYNDTIGRYLNSIVAYLYPFTDLEKQPTVYVIKSNYANAFATDDGQLLVTTGLIARLNTEAELAFVLCHEMVHFKKKHSIDIFIQKKVRTSKDYGENGGYESTLTFLSNAVYSKEKEFEADKLGYATFSRTKYSSKNVLQAFEVLRRSSLPFDSTFFDISFFETKNLVWPKSYILSKVSKPRFEEEDDKNSTHPNISKRVLAITEIGLGNTIGEDFIVSEDAFLLSKKISQFEFCRLALLNADFSSCIYASYCLLKRYPDNKFLMTVISKALYSLSRSKKNRHEKESDDKRFEGEQQKIGFFLNKLREKDAAVLSTDFCWRTCSKYDDKEVNTLLQHSFYNVSLNFYEGLDAFYNAPLPDSIINELKDFTSGETILKDTSTSLIPKKTFLHVDLITPKRIPNEIGIRKPFEKEDVEDFLVSSTLANALKYAFAEYITDTGFANSYSRSVPLFTSKKKGQIVEYNNRLDDSGKNIVFLSPLSLSIDARKNKPLRLIAGERDLFTLTSQIDFCASAAKISHTILAEKNIGQKDINSFNTLSILKDWIGESFMYEHQNPFPADYSLLKNISDTLNSSYVCLMGTVSFVEKKTEDYYQENLVLGVVLPLVSWPFVLSNIISKNQVTAHFMILLDLKTGGVVTKDLRLIKAKNRKDVSKSTVYDFMLKIKKAQLENQ